MAAGGFPRPFGRYSLLSNLAEGGMGALYLACQGEPGLEKLCVIKTVLPSLLDRQYVARFRDEAKVVVRLSHGNLVPVFDAGVVRTALGDEIYLAMEYVDGKDLRAVWNRCATKGIAFPTDVAVYIARELSRGLYHAHTFGAIRLVHRDVSPPNVLLSFSGEVKLTDFGLAYSSMKTEKTSPGIIYGKVSYMSPEQARGEALDGRSDLYSISVILWELLTGRQLFPQSHTNLIDRVRDPEVAAPSSLAARVPPALDAIVLQGLAKDRTLRFADCEALRAALSGFLARTAPTTDNARVQEFLTQLFGDEIEADRAARQRLLDGLAASAGGAEAGSSQPETLSLEPHPVVPQASKLIGTLLDGRYLVKRLVGEGGMGRVYEAEHIEIGRRVAVKLLHSVYSRSNEAVARFRSEARAATRIGHPHIIDVFDSGTTVDGAVYFVMEFLDGRNLAEMLKERAPLPVSRALGIARQICQALAAAHRAGIIHRDVKPENVFLIEREGRGEFVKVLDFGVATTHEGLSEPARPMSYAGVAAGTAAYMAPEQAAGVTADARADVYALGAIVYEMLAGQPPHPGENVLQILTRKATVAPPALGKLRADVPPGLERLVVRALAIAPEDRPQSMDLLGEELDALAEPRPGLPLGEATERVRPQRTPYLAMVALGIAVLGAGGLAWRSLVMGGGATARPLPPLASSPALGRAQPEPLVAAPAAVAPAMAPSEGRGHSAESPSPERPPGRKAQRPPDTVARQLHEAQAALEAGWFGRAEAIFHGLRGESPAAALTGLSQIAFERGDYVDAVRRARRALVAGGGVPAGMILGDSCYKLERYDEAIAAYQAVLQVDASHAEARRNLAAAEAKRADSR